MIKKIISGGQTGADQAALDVAIELGIEHGGWIPKGRITEAGPLDDKYQLKEMSTVSYPKRIEKNVMESDGTLIFARGKLTGSSALTRRLANQHGKPVLYINLDGRYSNETVIEMIQHWLEDHGIQILNVAGSRASKDPEIYRDVKRIIKPVVNE